MKDETKDERSWTARTAVVVFAVLAANAGTAFTIQAWMTFGFAKEVWKLPEPLCVALIVALDLFAVMFMILSYLLRGTGWPRFVVTAIFVFAIVVQVFAAEMFGVHEGWTMKVRWFAAIPAIFLALAQEGAILWRTHRGDLAARLAARMTSPSARTEKKTEARPVREVATPAQSAAGRSPVTERPARKDIPLAVPPTSGGKRSAGHSDQQKHDEYAKRAIDGEPLKTVAAAAGVSTRSVQNWMADYRKRHTAGWESPPFRPDGADVMERVNGVKPHLTEEVTA